MKSNINIQVELAEDKMPEAIQFNFEIADLRTKNIQTF